MMHICDNRVKFEELDFVGLRSYIDARLDDLRTCANSTEDAPTTEEEFLQLCELLEQKISAPARLPPQPALPPLPDKPIPPAPFSEYTPSSKLGDLEKQLREVTDAFHAKRIDLQATKRSKKKLEHKIEFLKEQVIPLRQREKAEYGASRTAYYRSHQAAIDAYTAALRYRDSLLQRHTCHCQNLIASHNKQRSDRTRFAQRVRRDVESAFTFGGSVSAVRLFWRVLPPGEWTRDSILHHYASLQRLNPHIRYDTERLERLFSLDPSTCYIGLDEFDGYIVFAFTHTRKVALECPVYGNAIYVIRENWQGLSNRTKYELLTNYSNLVYRIIHTGDWFWKLKAQLR